MLKKIALIGGLMIGLSQVQAATAKIAVASNFTKTIEEIGQAFSEQTGHQVKFAFGPTGKLFTQIKYGAPFDAFFGADEKRPKQTITAKLGVEDGYFVYAQGKLALYSHRLRVDQDPLSTLQAADFRYLAMANPRTAPYGERAHAFLQQKGLYQLLRSKFVNGESIAQAFQYVATQNAEIGFIALSQIVDPQSPLYQKGHYWVVPQADYAAINQGAVLLKRGQKNPAAVAFMQFMQTPVAHQIIEKYGYGLP